METIDLALRTLFQEFSESVFVRRKLENELSKIPVYVAKNIRKQKYWYQQRYTEQGMQQEYIGAHSPQLEKQVSNTRAQRKKLVTNISALKRIESKHITVLKRAKIPHVDSISSSLLITLSEQEICYRHGVLIGSHAFASFAGLLGKEFAHVSLRTLDIDVARDFHSPSPYELIELVSLFPKHLQDEFHEVPGFDHKSLPSAFKGPSNLRLDLLVPQKGKAIKNAVFPGVRGAGAQALPFLDYLLEETVDAVLLGTKEGIPVTVPHPTRFAFHKMLIAQRRPVTEQAKKAKDLLQASQLLVACAQEMPHELKAAYKACLKQSKACEKALKLSAKHLSEEALDVVSQLMERV